MDVTPGGRSRVRLDIVLSVLALLLVCVCVVGAVGVRTTHQQRADAAVEQQRYGDVLAAAEAEVEAFINIDHEHARASIDKVAAGATGTFREQYDSSSAGVVRALRENRSVMDGHVDWVGVVDVAADSATVIAATTGAVANRHTGDRPVPRSYRLRLDLVRAGGAWLTSDLEFVD